MQLDPRACRFYCKHKREERVCTIKNNFSAYIIASVIPVYDISPFALVRACKRVLTTSRGFTADAENAPAASPEMNE